MRKVLLLGSTGAVGAGCLDVLTRCGEVSLLIAGRDERRLRDVASAVRADVEILRLDIADVTAVTAAVTGCDVVINCAGPSRLFSAGVAAAAVAARVPYVDPGGDEALLGQLAASGAGVPVVVQAGMQPGLSGLLLRILALRRPGAIDSVTVWCGGLQRLTPASVREYLDSLHDTGGHPGAALRDGVIRRVGREECQPPPKQYFPDSATVHPHLDAEITTVATYLDIATLCWMNVFDGVRTTRAMQRLAVDGEGSRADVRDVLAAAELDLFGRQPYFAIVGTARGDAGCTTVAISCPDSYRTTGALVAFAASHTASMPVGVQPFWSIDEPQRVLEFLTESVPATQVSVIDNPIGDDQSSAIEEGSL